MTIRIRKGRIQLQVPGLTFVDDEYNLPEEYFEPGSIGRVESIVSQGGGTTTVKMVLVQGRALGRAQRQAALQNAQQTTGASVHGDQERPEIDPALAKALREKPSDRFQAGGDRIIQEGGVPDIPLPPTPVQGRDNRPVVNSPIDNPAAAQQIIQQGQVGGVPLEQQEAAQQAVAQEPSLIIQPGQPQQQPAASAQQSMFHPVLQGVMTPVQQGEAYNPRIAAQKAAQTTGIYLEGQGAPAGPGVAGDRRRSEYQHRIDAGQYGKIVKSVSYDADGQPYEVMAYQRADPLPMQSAGGSSLPRTSVRKGGD